MDLGINGRVALVIGGSRGLGFASATELAVEGAKVVIAARDQGRLTEAAREIAALGGEAVGVSADCLTVEGLDKAIAFARETYGEIDIVVYSPSITIHGWFDDCGDEEYAWGNAAMVTLFAYVCRAVLPHMKVQKWGRIVCVGSRLVKSVWRQIPRAVPNTYRLAQAGLCKTLSDEVGKFNITVNTLAAGAFESELFVRLFTREAEEKNTTYEQLHAGYVEAIPVRRLGNKTEFGKTLAFLCSNHAGFITGQQIMIDGGEAATVL